MKFFTRDLYDRGQSTDDAIVDVAEDEWEVANTLYEQHLRAIEVTAPPHIRAFIGLLLHDAAVQSIARHADRLVRSTRRHAQHRQAIERGDSISSS